MKISRNIYLICHFLAILTGAHCATANDLEKTMELEEGCRSAEFRFKFENRAPVPTQIISAVPSCPCVELKFTNMIPSASSADLLAKVNLTGVPGNYDYTIKVLTSPESTTRMFSLHVRVVPHLIVSPQALVWKAGQNPTSRKVYVRGSFAKTLVKLEWKNPGEQVEITQCEIVDGVASAVVQLKAADRPMAMMIGIVATTSTNNQLSSTIPIVVR